MSILHTDQVFAPVDRDHTMERVAGGNETEVYRTDDGGHVVKLKSDLGADIALVLVEARKMRAAAEQFALCLGPRHSIPNAYLIARDDTGRVQILVIQPFLQGTRPLHDLDYARLSEEQRASVATQLRDIIRRALDFYHANGSMPDLYGRTSSSSAERARLNGLFMLPWRLWSFVVGRNLLRSHNLMLTGGPNQQVVLVDYDIVRRGWLYRQLYYAVRWLLFWRDHVLILLMRYGRVFPR